MVNPETKKNRTKKKSNTNPTKKLEVTPDAHRGKVVPVSY
jgi:hypothetical protein